MEKSILISSIIALCIILFKYSDFENKGIAYALVLICLIGIAFSYAKLTNPTETKDEYQLIEEENNKLEDFDGIFEYKHDGFYIKYNNKTEFIKWKEILEVYFFRIPVLKHESQSGYEIITASKTYEFTDSETPGIYKLENMLAENLVNWKVDTLSLKVNNWGLEKAILYKKENYLN